MLKIISKLALDMGLPLIKKVADAKLSGKLKHLSNIAINGISNELGIDFNSKSSSDSLLTAYKTSPDVVKSVLFNQEKRLEVLFKEFDSISEYHREINETIRTEMSSESFLTRFWRPFFGIVYGVCFLSFWASFISLMLFYDADKLNNLMECSGIIISLFGMGASVLGVYVWKRSDEKIKR